MRPKLFLIAGPNGAGKSTLFETRVAPSFAGPIIIADNIQRDERDDGVTNTFPKRKIVFASRRLTEARPNLPDWMLHIYGDDLVL